MQAQLIRTGLVIVCVFLLGNPSDHNHVLLLYFPPTARTQSLGLSKHSKHSKHSQLLKVIILKFNSPALLNLLGNIFPYCPAVGAIRRINSSNIDLQEGQCRSCNWECLYSDLSWDIRWNIAWDLVKSLGLCPWDFPRAQAIFHRIYPSSCHNTDSIPYVLYCCY